MTTSLATYPTNVLLNDFAVRSFRDVADNDYIAARLAHRARLGPQFLWAALQAMEKYLKCILVLNRIAAPNSHDLRELLDGFGRHARFQLRLSAATEQLIEHLDQYGRHRYFEASYVVEDLDLVKLDRAVWEVRRYAQVIDREVNSDSDEGVDLLRDRLAEIDDAMQRPPQKFAIHGGRLEAIIGKADDPAREPLLWKNLFYGTRARTSVLLPTGFHAGNAPLLLHPEILDEVLKYVYLPKAVIKAYREHAASGKKY